ncbi:FAS1-like dehydratase domain-containing protein [Pseudomonas mucidolens]|uniref:Itaconyl-CoA hydratase / mesaconyl-C4 CoA hydratase n=1 Tax=Pseudomonas mucidolens TaxID=46679 RepID=A0A1H2MW56_9PSED|nr:MaoC family dehydratase N-terminal domain-containing protein [Pseudomonas mucidolens]SDU97533.1 itaconyl-CoA hydratase / mesaconyl-C4 CoA hydratase [Pseudomonas mucidolens]SQH33088.1 putative hydratase [Pseudomonas mucidolens]
MEYSEWIGKTQERAEVITSKHVAKLAVTLNEQAPADGSPLPLLWHWAYFQDLAFTESLRSDGHPVTGDFLPAAGDRTRMWAGGRLSFIKPLLVGGLVHRRSTIEDIKEKQGRTGSLLFVKVRHEYLQDEDTALIEEQDIVYRVATQAIVAEGDPLPDAEWTEEIDASPTLLFRYSAVTFNTHRIHYDWRYVTEVEGYPGLVVHGPLTATLVMRAFSKFAPEVTVRTFAFKGVRPLIAGDALIVGGRVEEEGRAAVWAGNKGGIGQLGEIGFA